MPPSHEDEAEFMRSLLCDLDAASSFPPPRTPLKTHTAKQVHHATEKLNLKARTRSKTVNGASTTVHKSDMDITTLLGGAESPSWSDMLSPVKTSSCTPQKPHAAHAVASVEQSEPKADKDTLPTIPVASATTHQEGIDIAMLLEGAEDWDWSDMLTPKKGTPSPKKARLNSGSGSPYKSLPHASQREYRGPICTRCIVESVSVTSVGNSSQKVLAVKTDPGGEKRTVILRDDWIMTDVCNGDVINIIGAFETVFPTPSSSITSTAYITAKSNYLIRHPDILVTATTLANAAQCRRKPILAGLVRSTSDVTPALVWGNILHEVMELCLQENCWDQAWIERKIDEFVRKNLVSVMRIEMSVEQASHEVKVRASGLLAFARKYMGSKPKSEGVLTDTRSNPGDPESLLAITDLLDAEEDIWSPTYGLKGKIDATVHSIISQPKPPPHQINHYLPKSTATDVISGAMPFEIKTGRTVAGVEHRAQTMLYALLVAERYHQEVDGGLLYYTQKEEVVRVPVVRNELKGLIMGRNDIAGYMKRRSDQTRGESETDIEDEPFLPPTIDDERVCKRCYALDTCLLYRKAVEGVVDTSSPIASTYELKTAHLTPKQLDFFKKWEKLISLEERDINRFKKELWTMGAKEREKKGRCFAGLVMDVGFDPAAFRLGGVGYDENGVDNTDADRLNLGKDKIHKFTYRFTRSSKAEDWAQNWTQKGSVQGLADGEERESLLKGHMSIGEPITISVEPDLLALARGFIVDLTPRTVTVGVDHKLDLERIRWRLATRHLDSHGHDHIVFRVDKDDLYGGMARIRDNLAHLFYAEGDATRLKFVVDLQKPEFEKLHWIGDRHSRDWQGFEKHTQKLNPNQKEAVKKVLSAKDYAIILGMPGTGKTGVIASLVKVLVSMGKSVLISAYTHSAVDNVLLRLKSEAGKEGLGFGLLRLGNLDKIHPDVQEFTLVKRKQATTVEQLQTQLLSPPLVATTCLSVDHAIFDRRRFDYCIIDEASQITLPACLGPLRFAKTFVLVGDHFQLPPLVRSVQARQGGLDISLFRRLADAHPKAVIELAEQYRMNEEIMTLSNRLIYRNKLKPGSESVRKRTLVIPQFDLVEQLCERTGCGREGERKCWLKHLLDENCKAVFVNTDNIPGHESRVGDLIQNEVEADLVTQVTKALIIGGVSPEEIGIITLYRQQLKLISHLLGERKDVEILTADRSQGRDKEVVIFSMVRSNDEGRTGELMKDWRRMNVSFTRARSKLIIFGSRRTLETTPLLKEFFNLMDEKAWVLNMPREAHVPHFSSMRKITPGNIDAEIDAKSGLESKVTPSKRNIDENENVSDGPDRDQRPKKQMKNSHGIDSGILKGKPLLQDVINEGL